MKSIVFALFLSLLSIINVLAQTEKPSLTTQYLKSQVADGNYDAIFEAVNSNDTTLLSYLKQLASNIKQRNNPNSSAFRAHIALAKLGDDEALQQILADVDAEHPAHQDDAMKKLSLIGGDEAFRKFYQLLDDTAARENPDCRKCVEEFRKTYPGSEKGGLCCDVIFFSRSTTAIYFLSKMVDNPPTERFAPGTKENISVWKEWFKKNKPYLQ